MSNARNISKAESRFVNATGDTISGDITTTGNLYTNGGSTDVEFTNGGVDGLEQFPNVFRAAPNDQRAAAFLSNNSTSPASVWWGYTDATDGVQRSVGAIDGVKRSQGAGLSFWGQKGTDSWVNGMTLYGDGHLRQHGQPVIAGQMGSAMTSPYAPVVLKFNDFWVNQGGIAYNSTTGRFTVPVAGNYRITMNPFKQTGDEPFRMLIGVNNDTPTTTTHRGHAYCNSEDYATVSLNSLVYLNANDYVVFYLQDGPMYNQSTDRFNQFSIELIG